MEKINDNRKQGERNETLPFMEGKVESGLERRKKLLENFIRKGLDTYGSVGKIINALIDKIKDPVLEKKKQKEICERYEKIK